MKAAWAPPTWVTEEVSRFAGRPDVARQADTTLEKLIRANSPVISEWMAKRGFQDARIPEDKIGREWREFYARMFVLNRGPAPALTDAISRRAFPSALKNKWTALFERARSASIKTVESFPISAEAKKSIVGQLKRISLIWNGGTALEFLEWGIAYQPTAQKIQMGIRALAYPNDATLFAVFAHELAHSFDSCRWGAFFQGEFPFQKIAECLRSPRSVGALKRDDGLLEDFQKKGRLTADLVAALRAHPTCNKSAYPPVGIQADQLPEAFADWFSARVVQNAKIPTESLRIDLCAPDQRQPGSSYPSNKDRLEKIYFAPPGGSCEFGA